MRRKNLKQKIKEYFFNNPTKKLRVRQIERILKLPIPSVIRYCKELKEENILKTTKISNVTFYEANRSSKIFLLEKKLFNIKMLYKSGLMDFLKKELSNPPIIVFGSYSRGEDIEKSDIDLFIETPGKKKLNLKKFEKFFGKPIQIFESKSIRLIKNTHLANNMVNGIILNNFLRVFK